MTFTESILAVLLSLPGVDPAGAARVAPHIAIVSPTPARAARTIAIGYWESKFLERIQAGNCQSYKRPLGWVHECDGERQRDGTVLYKARSWFQFQQIPSVPEWGSLLGLEPEPVRLAVTAADRLLQRGMRSCRTTEGSMAFFAKGQCRWSGAKKRALMAERIEKRLTDAR